MRYAVYFSPTATHPLWALGNHWLGRDPETGDTLIQPDVPGITANEVATITIAPRRYGLHATLKAPFRLADGHAERALVERIAEFSRARHPFELPRLEVTVLDGFIALQPSQPSAELHALADACVLEFDDFRAPPDAAELARRHPDRLGASSRAHLARWGYPYVFEDFRFHVTLTEVTTPDLRARLLPWLTRHFDSALQQPCRVDAIALFVEAAPQAPFRLIRRFPIVGGVA
jgi:putative phosphonate metabolism protein